MAKLLEQAQSLLEQCEYEAAAKFCQRAVDQAPANTEALELLATISLELGDVERAEAVSRCAVHVTASAGPLTARPCDDRGRAWCGVRS